MRGSTATASAAIPAATSGEKEGSGPRPSQGRQHQAAGGDSRGGALEDTGRRAGALRHAGGSFRQSGARASTTGIRGARDARKPDRRKVAGSTSPPSSVSSRSAACSSARRRAARAGGPGRSRAPRRRVAELSGRSRRMRPARAADGRAGAPSRPGHRRAPGCAGPGLVEGQRERVDVAGGGHASPSACSGAM